MRVKKNRGLVRVDVETYCSAHNLFYSEEPPEKALGVSVTILQRFFASEKFVRRYFGKKEFYGHVRRDGDCWLLSPKFMELCARAHCDNRGFRAREIFSELSRFPVSAGEEWPPVQTETVQ